MAANIKSKEIQVQKPAQSLQAFQQKLAQSPEDHTSLLKPVAIAASAVVLLAVGVFGFRSWRSSKLEKYEASQAKILTQIQGEDMKPLPTAELEKKMRELLPQLEKLAADAPSAAKPLTQNLITSWKLQLDGKAPVVSATDMDEWDRLRAAQRQLALGQADEAAKLLNPLKSAATPDAPWATAYWSALMDLHRLKGDRTQAWKDYSEYKSQYKDRADASLEKVLASI